MSQLKFILADEPGKNQGVNHEKRMRNTRWWRGQLYNGALLALHVSKRLLKRNVITIRGFSNSPSQTVIGLICIINSVYMWER